MSLHDVIPEAYIMSQADLDYTNHILQPDHAAHLINQGLASHVTRGGARWISRQQLPRIPIYDGIDYASFTIPPQVNPLSNFVLIPEKFISRATLELIGFTSEKATWLWDTWIEWLSSFSTSMIILYRASPRAAFVGFVESYIFSMPETQGEDLDEWRRCMSRYGLVPSAQDYILGTVMRERESLGWLGLSMPRRGSSWRTIEFLMIHYTDLQAMKETSWRWAWPGDENLLMGLIYT